MFSEREREYLTSERRLARIATVDADGQPDVTPVGFDFDGARFYVGGMDVRRTRKYRNVAKGNRKVALVIDDAASVNPWRPRGIRVYGLAEPVEREGYAGWGTYLQITPTLSWNWGLGEDSNARSRVRTVHSNAERVAS